MLKKVPWWAFVAIQNRNEHEEGAQQERDILIPISTVEVVGINGEER